MIVLKSTPGRQINIIKDLHIAELSLCDQPANKRARVTLMKSASRTPTPQEAAVSYKEFFAVPGSVVAVVEKMAEDSASKSGRTKEQEFSALYMGDPGLRDMVKADERRLHGDETLVKRQAADEEYTRLAKAIQSQAGCTLTEAFNRAAATTYGQELRAQRLAA